MAPHDRIPNTTTDIHPHTPIQTHPQWYSHNYIPTVVTLPPLLPIRRTELILVLWTTSWNIKTFYEDQDITQLLWDTPIRWLLCSLFRKLSQTLFITNLFGSNNIFLYNLCHHIVFSLWDVPANITLPPIPVLTSIVTPSSHGHSPEVPFFQSWTNIAYVNPAMHEPKIFFDIQHLNALITFQSNLHPV